MTKWSRKELKLLFSDTPFAEISRLTGKVKGNIRRMASYYHIKKPGNRLWSEDEETLLRSDKPHKEVAELTGRSYDAVRRKRLNSSIHLPSKKRTIPIPEIDRLLMRTMHTVMGASIRHIARHLEHRYSTYAISQELGDLEKADTRSNRVIRNKILHPRKNNPELVRALIDLPENGCKYPLDSDTFCGKPASKVYCSEHHRLTHVDPEKKVIIFTGATLIRNGQLLYQWAYKKGGITLRSYWYGEYRHQEMLAKYDH